MPRRRAAAAGLAVALLVAGGAVAEGGTGEAPPAAPTLAGTLWSLETLDGAPFGATARIVFAEDEAGAPLVRGEAPCNGFRGIYGVETPEGGMFDAGPLAMTRMACPELEAEGAFLTALEAATEARIEDGRLVLSGPGGARLAFTAEGPAPIRPGDGTAARE